MEKKVLEDIVSMVKQQPTGIPLKKLAVFYSQKYHKNLILSSLGFDSMASLVDFLAKDLIVEREVVFHKIHICAKRAGAAAGAMTQASEDGMIADKVLEDIVSMLKEHPAGIPLKKLAVFYSQTYHRNLILSLLGFDSMTSLVDSLGRDVVVEGQVVFHKIHHHAGQAGAAVGSSTEAKRYHVNTEKVLENIVSMVKKDQDGIPLQKLAVCYSQIFHKNLTLSLLGFDSMASLVDSLGRDLVVEGKLVFHRDHRQKSQAEAVTGPSSSVKSTEGNDNVKKVLENLEAMVKEHPEGIPLNRITKIYSQVYHQNLTVASLGFKTISSLIESLKGLLVMRGDVVFHTIYQPQDQPGAGTSKEATANSSPATPKRTEPLVEDRTTPTVTVPLVDVNSYYVPPTQAGISFLGPPLLFSPPSFLSTQCSSINPPFAASKPDDKLTQQQLYQRVLEVSCVIKNVHHHYYLNYYVTKAQS